MSLVEQTSYAYGSFTGKVSSGKHNTQTQMCSFLAVQGDPGRKGRQGYMGLHGEKARTFQNSIH